MASYREGKQLTIDGVLISDTVEISLASLTAMTKDDETMGTLGNPKVTLKGHLEIGEAQITCSAKRQILDRFDDGEDHIFAVQEYEYFENKGTNSLSYDIVKHTYKAKIGNVEAGTVKRTDSDSYVITLTEINGVETHTNGVENLLYYPKTPLYRKNGKNMLI